ncbi:hypothetical protein OAA15_00185 [bacterium]|nr:hypothetical protein [bacterium]
MPKISELPQLSSKNDLTAGDRIIINDNGVTKTISALDLSESGQGYYGLLSAYYFDGAATSTEIEIADINVWQDVVMDIHPQGISDERIASMINANASGHTGDGSVGNPIIFLLEGLQQSSAGNLRASLSYNPDEDGGRLDARMYVERHSGATPSSDFVLDAAGLSMESGAEEDYPHYVNIKFFVGDTIDTYAAGDAGKIRFQIKSDVPGTVSMNEVALFIQF